MPRLVVFEGTKTLFAEDVDADDLNNELLSVPLLTRLEKALRETQQPDRLVQGAEGD